MSKPPFLVLQMQRMGDLILSFPLLGWLGSLYPDHPLWVVGEKNFFTPLMSLSPNVTYFHHETVPNLLRSRSFAGIINLSHRAEASALAGSLKSDMRFGPWQDSKGRIYISGDWQLYRASLTHNNRYNLYHWSDLNALDCIPLAVMRRTHWPLPSPLPRARSGPARIGMFLGASEEAKHPDAAFWAALAGMLLRHGHKPVLLGGKAEMPLGRTVADLLQAPFLNLCGRFTIDALARFIRELDLLITPDTGPMHISAWLGTPVLNLSMGPVNPWETGPFSPGHHIVRALLDCVSCWACAHKRPVCYDCINPASIADITAAILDGELPRKAPVPHPGSPQRKSGRLEILCSRRERHGLYHLDTLVPDPLSSLDTKIQARRRISLFWQAWFGHLFRRFSAEESEAAWADLRATAPEQAQALVHAAADFALLLAKSLRVSSSALRHNPDFWKQTPPPLHPLSSYIQMYIQNADASASAVQHALALAEQLAALR